MLKSARPNRERGETVYYIGVDIHIHKAWCETTVMDEQGTIVETARVPTRTGDLQTFFSRYRAVARLAAQTGADGASPRATLGPRLAAIGVATVLRSRHSECS